MKERVFLADAREANGLHDGSITRIVRVLDPQPVIRDGRVRAWGAGYVTPDFGEPEGEFRSRAKVFCSFGVPGGRLWVQERWAQIGTPHGPRVIHSGERVGALLDAIFEDEETGEGIEWQPPSEMHRESCRTILDLTDVSVIRVRDISLEDIEACGVTASTHATPARGQPYEEYAVGGLTFGTPRYAFRSLWPKAIWDANDYVWIGTVKRTRKGTA